MDKIIIEYNKMMIEFYKETDFHKIRANVKGYSLEGISLKKAMSKQSGEKRLNLCSRKKSIGFNARLYYLIYGMIREIPYKNIEKNCADNNKPNAQNISNILKYLCELSYHKEWTENKIQAWLDSKEYIETELKLPEIKQQNIIEKLIKVFK